MVEATMLFRDSRHVRVAEVGQVTGTRRTRAVFILSVPVLSLLLPALAVALASAGGTSQVTRITAAIARFLLFYSGVFALIALSGAVAAGLLATDRTVMSPDRRILAQALHRTMSVIGISALANHIMLEVLAHRARIADGFVPFMAARSTFYMGLGTLASDLFVVIIVTGILRRRFARGARRRVWRALHATAYAAWPLAVLHGLLAGRPARPYVDWSYGGCLAAVALALTIRCVAIMRGRNAPTGTPGRGARVAVARAGAPPALAADLAGQLDRGAPQRGPARQLMLPAAAPADDARTDPGGWAPAWPPREWAAPGWAAPPDWAPPDWAAPDWAPPDWAPPDWAPAAAPRNRGW